MRESGRGRRIGQIVEDGQPRELVERKKSGFFVPLAPLLDDPRAGLDGWKRVPELARARCHWSRRLAYVLEHEGVV